MKKLLLLACLFLAPLLGCGANRAEPIGLEQVTAEFDKAFKSSNEETRGLTQAIARLVGRKQYAPASMQLQTILGDPSLTKEQRSVVARVLTSVNAAMQAQVEVQESAVAATPSAAPRPASQAVPDFSPGNTESSAAEAQAVLQNYRRTK
jgi:hypothetical protein